MGERKANGFEYTYSFLNLVTQVTILVTMILGVVTLFSNALNPITAVKSIIALFSIRRGAIFKTLSSTAVSVLYIVYLCFTLKSAVNVFKSFRLTIKKNDEYDKRDWIARSYRELHGSTFKTVFIMLLCLMLDGKITLCGYIMTGVFLGNFLITSILTFVETNRAQFKTKENIREFIFLIIRNLLFVAWACLALAYFIQPSARDLWFGFRSIFSTVGGGMQVIEGLYELLVRHVLDIIIAYTYYRILRQLFWSGYSSNYSTNLVCSFLNKASKLIMVLAGVSAVIACVLPFITGVYTKFNFSIVLTMFFSLRGHYIPVILFAGMIACFAAKPFDRPDFS